MAQADPYTYLADLVRLLRRDKGAREPVHLVCHGHSVPAGNFASPNVRMFDAYPHLLHRRLAERFPLATLNVIVTAIGAENSASGAERFERDVLTHRPQLVTIDYSLNDRKRGLELAAQAWRRMIEAAQAAQTKVILLTPTADINGEIDPQGEAWTKLQQHAAQVRRLAEEYGVGLADSLTAFEAHQQREGTLTDVLSWGNHPNREGHALVAQQLVRWFPLRVPV